MIFEINFNNENDRDTILALGAEIDYDRDSGNGAFLMEVNTFEELEDLLKRVNTLKKTGIQSAYSAVISFDHPTIFFDNKC